MTLYLNTNAAYKDFEMLRNDKYFVDKSGIIEKVSERIKTKDREYCEKLKKENVENILMVGISYDTDKKEHQCRIEEL